MIWLGLALALLLGGAAVLAWRWRHPEKGPNRITPPARRILFPFVGQSISPATLDAALRLARAEGATLVPAYLVTVPLNLSLDAPVPNECEQAMPLLETIEQRAARLHVPVDSRIETGRTPRHALRQLVDQETFDRLVVPAASRTSEGFSSEDIAWLLEHAPGEIVVLRPEVRMAA
jgi:nucleotide-binding universal stress UspA family protein